jgi:hypothetical protein
VFSIFSSRRSYIPTNEIRFIVHKDDEISNEIFFSEKKKFYGEPPLKNKSKRLIVVAYRLSVFLN